MEFQDWWTKQYGVINKQNKALCVTCSDSVVEHHQLNIPMKVVTNSFLTKRRLVQNKSIYRASEKMQL